MKKRSRKSSLDAILNATFPSPTRIWQISAVLLVALPGAGAGGGGKGVGKGSNVARLNDVSCRCL